MLIDHPLLGPRDAAEFTCLGDAALLKRPPLLDPEAPITPSQMQEFVDYLHLRDNPAGQHQELWYHEQGDRSWLVVTRDTLTHEVITVELARDIALRIREKQGASS